MNRPARRLGIVKKTFHAYYRLSEGDIASLWKEGLIVPDANVLLNVYRWSESTATELLKLFKALKERLWLPHQVGREFYRNRLSVISEGDHKKWFQQVWSGVTGASTRKHPAPFPLELAERLIRMFSFVGDTILDPFMGTGTTNVAAAKWGRNSIGFEVDTHYYEMAAQRLTDETTDLFSRVTIREREVLEKQARTALCHNHG